MWIEGEQLKDQGNDGDEKPKHQILFLDSDACGQRGGPGGHAPTAMATIGN